MRGRTRRTCTECRVRARLASLEGLSQNDAGPSRRRCRPTPAEWQDRQLSMCSNSRPTSAHHVTRPNAWRRCARCPIIASRFPPGGDVSGTAIGQDQDLTRRIAFLRGSRDFIINVTGPHGQGSRLSCRGCRRLLVMRVGHVGGLLRPTNTRRGRGRATTLGKVRNNHRLDEVPVGRSTSGVRRRARCSRPAARPRGHGAPTACGPRSRHGDRRD